jgi:polyferredoxin
VTLLADVIVVIHAIVAAFITLGFVLIPLGAWLGWEFVRWRLLRLAHLIGILFVAGETVLGVACPLTIWEAVLRRESPNEAGFVAGWARSALYYDAPLWVFGLIYALAAAFAVYLWRWVPPVSARFYEVTSKATKNGRQTLF